MDTKSKIVIGIFFALLAAATVWKYYVFVTLRDFVVYNQISCDPASESCFSYECDPDDDECDPTPFKKIEKIAKNIPTCELGECEELSCSEGEEGCVITDCTEESLEDGEICLGPLGDGPDLTDEPLSEEAENEEI